MSEWPEPQTFGGPWGMATVRWRKDGDIILWQQQIRGRAGWGCDVAEDEWSETRTIHQRRRRFWHKNRPPLSDLERSIAMSHVWDSIEATVWV